MADRLKFDGCGRVSNTEAISATGNGSLVIENSTISDEVHASGLLSVKESSVGSIFGNGSVELSDVIVQGGIRANGSVKGFKVKVARLVASGTIALNDCHVSSEAILNGSIDAIDCAMETLTTRGRVHLKTCKIAKNMTICSPKATLHDVNVLKITVTNIFGNIPFVSWLLSRIKKPVLKLKGNTVVDGDIIFEGVSGTVILLDSAKINGVVHGGTVQQR